MEIKIGDYGRMIFEMILGEKNLPDHWKSIHQEAKPLVLQLLSLNEKMENGGYNIVGYQDETGNKKLSEKERLKLTEKELFGVFADQLNKGDYVWLFEDPEFEMYVGEHDPIYVDYVAENFVLLDHPYDRYSSYKISKKTMVLKAPKDWMQNQSFYSNEWWLEQADKLGI